MIRFSLNAFKVMLKVLASVLLLSCASKTGEWATNNPKIVWPSPPAQARISYIGSFSTPKELGIYPGFWQTLSEFFTGEKESRLLIPMSVVMTSNRQIYVADPAAGGVHRFDLEESEYTLITGADETFFKSPVALSLGPDNSVFVTDSVLASIFQIQNSNEKAERVLSKAEMKRPTGIAYSKNTKRLFVSDTINHQVKIFSLDGKLQKVIGGRGTGEGQFNYPTYLWLDSKEHLLVTDSLNFRIQRFDQEGNFISKFGKAGNAPGSLARPKGVASNQYGDIFVIDALFNALQIFNQQGALLLPLGRQGQQSGEFWLPTGVFVSDSNEIYIADSYNKRIQILGYVGGSK